MFSQLLLFKSLPKEYKTHIIVKQECHLFSWQKPTWNGCSIRWESGAGRIQPRYKALSTQARNMRTQYSQAAHRRLCELVCVPHIWYICDNISVRCRIAGGRVLLSTMNSCGLIVQYSKVYRSKPFINEHNYYC